ncbi:MAG: DUF2589 domain-containing protein [Pseudomonadota bacterium]
MLSQGRELAAIDFSQVIGGPLEAVITAQANAANVTTQFIQNTAFEKPSGNQTDEPLKLKVVPFDYGQMLGAKSAISGGLGGDALTIKVPLLTMLPIPFIRVDSMTIDLNVSLHSTQSTSIKNEADASASASGGENLEVEHSSWQTSVTDKNTFQHNNVIDDTYSLRVTVHAVQDSMPGGMRNVLDIFSNVIQQQSALIQQVMSESISAQSKALTESMKANSAAQQNPH